MSALQSFLNTIQESIQKQEFIKLSLGNYKGEDKTLKNVYIKPVLIKRELKLSFTFRHQTKDITKNFSLAETLAYLQENLQFVGFRMATLQVSTEQFIMQMNKKGSWSLKQQKSTVMKQVDMSHDKQKERKVGDTTKRYLQDLRLTDAEGKVFKNAQDKWKQINHYIELLSTELTNLPAKDNLSVVDMGAGKGYLTFALYDYLNSTLGRKTSVIGVEYRDDLVDLCNSFAKNADFQELKFVQGTIEDYQPAGNLDILIALHACDTATDDAIYKGINYGAELIVVAPCCHKQVRRQLEKVKAQNDLDFLTKHGIFMERHAEMLTDGIRSLILEYYGYHTKVMQFVSDAHTAKNVMIVAVKRSVSETKKAEILAKLKSLKVYFGIEYQYLERLCGL